VGTKIEWTEKTLNPIIGCSKVSEECRGCYAERMAQRLVNMGNQDYTGLVDNWQWTGKTRFLPKRLNEAFRWRKPTMCFLVSMGDLFHKTVMLSDIDTVLDTCVNLPQHTFLVLTKRVWRAQSYFERRACNDWGGVVPKNIWVGTTAGTQSSVDHHLSHLVRIPASVRFLSAEPLLERIDITPYTDLMDRGIDWVIAGCGTGNEKRPTDPIWVRHLKDQCTASCIPFFLKKLKIDGKAVSMPRFDGQVWNQMPEVY